MENTTRNKHRLRTVIIILLVLLFVLYNAAVNVIISAALVPDFMRKLDQFEKATEQGYAQMVHTDQMTINTQEARKEAQALVDNVPPQYYATESKDGYRLIAAVFRQEDPSEKWVMLLHGYTGWKEEMYHFAARYYEQGWNVICPDMRCQGSSEGDFIGMGWTDAEDNMIWLSYILSGDPDAKIVLHGESMGAACADMMSGMELPENVVCVISDCAYKDVPSIFRKQLKDWFSIPDIGIVRSASFWLQVRGGYNIYDADTAAQVAKSNIPTFFIHGTEDKFVPPADALVLYDACSAPKDIMMIDGAGHAQCSLKDPDMYYAEVFGFIDQHILEE